MLASFFRSQLKGHLLGRPSLSTPRSHLLCLTYIICLIVFATIWKLSSSFTCILVYFSLSLTHMQCEPCESQRLLHLVFGCVPKSRMVPGAQQMPQQDNEWIRLCFTNEKTEAQRGEESCPGPHNLNDLKALRTCYMVGTTAQDEVTWLGGYTFGLLVRICPGFRT